MNHKVLGLNIHKLVDNLVEQFRVTLYFRMGYIIE